MVNHQVSTYHTKDANFPLTPSVIVNKDRQTWSCKPVEMIFPPKKNGQTSNLQVDTLGSSKATAGVTQALPPGDRATVTTQDDMLLCKFGDSCNPVKGGSTSCICMYKPVYFYLILVVKTIKNTYFLFWGFWKEHCSFAGCVETYPHFFGGGTKPCDFFCVDLSRRASWKSKIVNVGHKTTAKETKSWTGPIFHWSMESFGRMGN